MFPALSGNFFRLALPGFARSFHSLLPKITPLNATGQNTVLRQSPGQLLATQGSPLVNLVCGFKVKGRLKRRCKDCFFVWRQQRLYNICKTHPRHKQMSMVKKDKNTWILTHASQSKVREW
ncbi:39S ribosomal protein L36, mitochondrial [Phlebotomus papatasi]|uniref:39S ribosomal protein L36, mitochondrial n=1 Tax=Phlebotomus papatasi TaxID=29031 RepID=UPI002483CCF3|nr:39S ribosomal protein L36, mitochondrial [Phlebotomus papatasi]